MFRKLLLLVSTTILLLSVFHGFYAFSKPNKTKLQEDVHKLINDKDANFGIAVKYNNKTICAINSNNKYPMMSVFKLHQAAYILNNHFNIEDTVFISKEMMNQNTYSPLRDKFPNGNFNISIKDIIEYSVCQSDNIASNILFSLYNGPKPVHTFSTDLGCNNTQIKWTEEEMHSDFNRCYENYTTPNDAIILLEKLATENKNKNILWLNKIISETKTGINRLAKHLIKENITLHHKTGTGFSKSDGTITAINDIGYVKFPDGDYFFIAVFCTESKLSTTESEAIIAEISKLTYRYISELKN